MSAFKMIQYRMSSDYLCESEAYIQNTPAAAYKFRALSKLTISSVSVGCESGLAEG